MARESSDPAPGPAPAERPAFRNPCPVHDIDTYIGCPTCPQPTAAAERPQDFSKHQHPECPECGEEMAATVFRCCGVTTTESSAERPQDAPRSAKDEDAARAAAVRDAEVVRWRERFNRAMSLWEECATKLQAMWAETLPVDGDDAPRSEPAEGGDTCILCDRPLSDGPTVSVAHGAHDVHRACAEPDSKETP
jgi:hypothetical protein